MPHAHKAQNAFDRSRCGAGQGGAVVHCSRAHHPVHVRDVLASDQARQLCTASFSDVVHSPTQLQREPATSYAVSHGDQTKDIWHPLRSGCMYAPGRLQRLVRHGASGREQAQSIARTHPSSTPSASGPITSLIGSFPPDKDSVGGSDSVSDSPSSPASPPLPARSAASPSVCSQVCACSSKHAPSSAPAADKSFTTEQSVYAPGVALKVIVSKHRLSYHWKRVPDDHRCRY